MAENRVLFISSRLEDFGRQSWKCFDRLLPKIDWHRYANAPWWALISLSSSVLYCCIYFSFLFDMYLYSGGDLYRQFQMPDRLYRYVCCVCVWSDRPLGDMASAFAFLKFSLLHHAEWIYPPSCLALGYSDRYPNSPTFSLRHSSRLLLQLIRFSWRVVVFCLIRLSCKILPFSRCSVSSPDHPSGDEGHP